MQGGAVNKIVRRSSVWPATMLASLLLVLAAGGASAVAQETPLPDLSGRWIMVQELATYAILPLVGEIHLTTTISSFSDAIQDGANVTLQDAYCFTDLAVTTTLFVTEIPDEAMQSLRPDPRAAQLAVEGDTVRLVQDWYTEVRGAKLEDPVNDPLPISPSDPRIIDQEGDGKLGITIPVELVDLLAGETYVIQRFRYRLEGDVIDADTIIGLVEWTTEQTIVSATDALFFMPYEQVTDPDPRRSRFVMVRVDDSWDCETAREQLEALIALLPSLPERVIEDPTAGDPAAEEPATP